MSINPLSNENSLISYDSLLPKRRPLAHRIAGREALVRDPESAIVHFLSPTAALIWECCDGNTTLAACEARLRDSFDVPADTDLARDIREALAGFAGKGLLEAANG